MADDADSGTEQARLLARVALGDRQAFRRFYDATAARVFALALRMLGDRARAEDLLQDVYLRVWYRAVDYHPGKGEPMAWLMTIARNRAIDTGRSASNRDLPLDAIAEPEAGPPSAADDADHRESDRLHRCIALLDGAQRQSIFCAFFYGLSHAEIARRFREPVGTVKTRIRRGLAMLRECLES